MARIRIGELLVEAGHIDRLQLESALAHQRQWGGRIGQAIVSLGFMTERALLEAVGAQLGAPFVEIGHRDIPMMVVGLLPRKLIRSHRVLPLEKLQETRRGPLVVAFANPADLGAVDELTFASGLLIRPVLAAEHDIEQAIERHLGPVHAPGSVRPAVGGPPAVAAHRAK